MVHMYLDTLASLIFDFLAKYSNHLPFILIVIDCVKLSVGLIPSSF